jgi:hypothetical protein
MTQSLQNALHAQLRTKLANLTPRLTFSVGQPGVSAGPLVAVYEGDTQILAKGSEHASSQPKAIELQELIDITSETAYPLKQTPVQGSVQVRLVFNSGGLEVYERPLAKEDFRVDGAAPGLSTQADLGGAKQLRVRYSYYGLITTLEFSQALYLEVISPDAALRERIAALCAAVLITEHDVLIGEANESTALGVYAAGGYISQISFGRITWADSSVITSGAVTSLRMRFVVTGQIRNIKTRVEGVNLIKSIRSPGTVGGEGVDILPEVG